MLTVSDLTEMAVVHVVVVGRVGEMMRSSGSRGGRVLKSETESAVDAQLVFNQFVDVALQIVFLLERVQIQINFSSSTSASNGTSCSIWTAGIITRIE
jgi:hypothetical protein